MQHLRVGIALPPVTASSLVVHRPGRDPKLDVFDVVDWISISYWALNCRAVSLHVAQVRQRTALFFAVMVLVPNVARVYAGPYKSRPRRILSFPHACMRCCRHACTYFFSLTKPPPYAALLHYGGGAPHSHLVRRRIPSFLPVNARPIKNPSITTHMAVKAKIRKALAADRPFPGGCCGHVHGCVALQLNFN